MNSQYGLHKYKTFIQISVNCLELCEFLFYIFIQMKSITRLVTIAILFVQVLADCPIIPYPSLTHSGTISVEINNDLRLHSAPISYTYPLNRYLNQNGVSVGIGTSAMQFIPNNNINFNIQHLPTTALTFLIFRIKVADQKLGWNKIQFYFFASQNPLFQISTQTIQQFSLGLGKDKFAIYRTIPNFNSFQIQPTIKIFISGLNIKARPLDGQYSKMVSQFEGFKKFSNNAKLIASYAQALEVKKSIAFQITEVKIIGRLFNLMLETNSDLISLSLSSIVFSKPGLGLIHNFVTLDITLVNNNQFKFTSLQNMERFLVGITGLKIPRDKYYEFNLDIKDLGGLTYLNAFNNFKYFQLYFSMAAFQLKFNYACQDCPNSTIIFDNRFCVSQCPRLFSISERNGLKFCDRCDIDKLKVIDSGTGQCVCAKRHFFAIALDTCKPCRYDCLTCDSAERCLTCDNSFLTTKRKLSNIGKCECPVIGYYDDSSAENIVCQKCHPDCKTCNGPLEHDCLTCQISKQVDKNGFCVCQNGFIPDDSGNCVCPSPRTLTQSNTCVDFTQKCGANEIQQFVNQIKKCICRPGFLSVRNQCIKCDENSIFNENSLKCECINNTIEINGQCQKCGNNQIYDSFYKTCICASGSFKNSQGSCITCPRKMVLFNDNCECIFNYFNDSSNKECRPCLKETDGPKCKRNIF